MDNIAKGRRALQAWEKAKPDNFFTADTNFQYALRRYLPDTAYAELEKQLIPLGGQAATVIDLAAKVEDRLSNHPRLERWDGPGSRHEAIEFHPNHDLVGRLVWDSGVIAIQATPGQSLAQMALYYLLCHNGEHGHLCSLACTAGLVRALQYAADDATRERFLPPLLDRNYDTMQHGAQFLTEVQGGSDVGANAVSAHAAKDGTWRINGEKWFCSNINADQFLMTARTENAPDGTRGLGLFLVPRLLDDGSTNGFFIRRLKDKIGTRTLASAELDFQEAVAYAVGPVDRGFKNTVELVLNTSRLMNAFGSSGAIRRAYLEAAHYAMHRSAFGQTIASYPLVQEAIADLLSESYAALAASLYIAHLQDRIDTGQASESDQAAFRLLINVNKYLTSIRASEMVHRAIEVLGGNGAIESFSILPRLYRDMIVLESWEGTHNVLGLQVLRDCARYGIHQGFYQTMTQLLGTVTQPRLQANRRYIQAALESAFALAERLKQADLTFAQAHARRLMDASGQAAQAVLLLVEAQWELDQNLPTVKPDVLDYFVNRTLRTDYDPLDDVDYLARVERLMMAL